MHRAVVLLICGMVFSVVAQNIQEDVPFEETVFGSAMTIESRSSMPRDVFPASENQACFSFFSGVTNVQVVNGKLTFTLTSENALLGWGNYERKWPECPVRAYPATCDLKLFGAQSEACTWTVIYKDPLLSKSNSQLVTGKAPKKKAALLMEFPRLRTGGKRRYDPSHKLVTGTASTGSLEFRIAGKPGTVIEIESVEIISPLQTVFARYEFTLPEGKVWRALADVCSAIFYGSAGNRGVFYVNGHVIDLPKPVVHRFNAYTYDIAPYLKPGKNVVAMNIDQFGIDPVVFMQSRIVFESGALIEVASGPGWRYAFKEAPGWNQVGFDDSAWNVVTQQTALARAQVKRGLNSTDFWLPVHHGRIVLANPLARDLFYAESEPVLIEAHIPAGLKNRAPSMAYAVGINRAGGVEPVLDGVLRESRMEGGNLVFKAELGKLPAGVYVAAFTLKDQDGALIEARPREPFVVLPRISGRKTFARSYDENLDLELEDTIDFADPNDPHPGIETCPAEGAIKTPVIVKKGALHYREASSWRREAGFSYRIEFKHPGDFYLLELEYPDDAKRIIEIAIDGKRPGVWNNVQSSSGAETGGRHLPTDSMQKLQWLHVADPGVHSVDLVNHRNYEKVAARTLKIYRVKGRLPVLDSGTERLFGQYTENIKIWGGVGNVFGKDRIGPTDNLREKYQTELELPLMAWNIMYLQWWFDTFDRYMQYNKFCGRNLLIMGSYQYKADLTPFLRAPEYKTWRINQCPRRMLAQFMDKNDMSFYTEVEWKDPPPPLAPDISDAEMEAGAETQRMVSRDGNQLRVSNWLHPEIKAKYEHLMDELFAVFGDLKHYRGVHTVLNPRSVVWTIPGFASRDWDTLYSSYDDITFRLFENEVGAKTGIAFDDTNRFKKRAELIERDAVLRERFFVWRAGKTTSFFGDMAGRLRANRADMELALVHLANFWCERGELFESLIERKMDMEAYLKTAAIDVKGLDAVPGIFVGRWATAWSRSKEHPYNTTQDPYMWLGQMRPEYTALFNRYSPERRYVLLYADWNESYFSGPNVTRTTTPQFVGDSDWIMTRQLIRCHSQFGGFNAREPLTQALIVSDPNMIGHGVSDLALPIGHEQVLRSIVRIISHLPKELFKPVLETGLDSNLAIRQLQRGSETWFYVANPCQWPVKGVLAVEDAGAVVTVPDGVSVGNGTFKLAVDLEPFGVAAYRSTSGKTKIAGYTTEPLAGEWLERIRKVIGEIRGFVRANAELLADTRKAFIEERLRVVEQDLADGANARAWLNLTDPEVWLYYVYEPACDMRIRKPILAEYLAEKPARLPAEFAKTAMPAVGARREMNVVRAKSAIKIDGVLTEKAWADIVLSSDFWSWPDQTNAFVETGVSGVYDDEALYLAFVCADPDTSQVQARARSEREFWGKKDDALGIMLYLKDQHAYYQLGFNTKKARFDQKVNVGGKTMYEEYEPEWKFATKLHGKYWIAEVRMPWAAIGLEKPPQELRANFFRSFRYGAVSGGNWSPAASSHDYDLFGVLIFGE